MEPEMSERPHFYGNFILANYLILDAACKTIYIRKTIYFAYAKLYVLYKVYTFAYAKTYTCTKYIVLHMQKYMFCKIYEKLYILNKKRRAFHEETPTTKITTDNAFVFCVWRHVANYFWSVTWWGGVLGFTNAV